MGYHTARRIHVLLMGWLTLGFLTAWLPLLRGAMDGPGYRWGGGLLGMEFSGAGLSGDYYYVVARAAIGLLLLFYGWRRPNGPFRLALLGWLLLMLADTLVNVIGAPDDFRFSGDTLGIDISLAVAAPLLDATMLLLACAWFLKAPALPVPPLARTNLVLLGAAGALLPVQYALLSAGSGQDANDVAGVLLTILGWFLLSAGLGLWRLPRPRRGLVTAAT